jgi:hypothetical protein
VGESAKESGKCEVNGDAFPHEHQGVYKYEWLQARGTAMIEAGLYPERVSRKLFKRFRLIKGMDDYARGNNCSYARPRRSVPVDVRGNIDMDKG